MSIKKRRMIMSYQNHMGYRLALTRGMCDMTQQAAADALGLSGQQAVSEIEQRESLTDQELAPYAALYKVTVEYIKTFNIDSIGKTVVHVHDQGQSHGNGSTASTYNLSRAEEVEKAKEEIRQLYERIVEAEKRVAEVEREKNAALQSIIETQKEAIALLKETNQQLQKMLDTK